MTTEERLALVVQGPATLIVGRDEMRTLLEKVKYAETLITEDESYSRNLRDALNRAVRAEARGNELQRTVDKLASVQYVTEMRLQQVHEAYDKFREETTHVLNAHADATAGLHNIIMDLRAEARLYVPDGPVAGLVTTF